MFGRICRRGYKYIAIYCLEIHTVEYSLHCWRRKGLRLFFFKKESKVFSFVKKENLL